MLTSACRKTDGRGTYFEGKDVVFLSFRTNIPSQWKIHISGEGFPGPAGTSIPISRLLWKMEQENTVPCLPRGNPGW